MQSPLLRSKPASSQVNYSHIWFIIHELVPIGGLPCIQFNVQEDRSPRVASSTHDRYKLIDCPGSVVLILIDQIQAHERHLEDFPRGASIEFCIKWSNPQYIKIGAISWLDINCRVRPSTAVLLMFSEVMQQSMNFLVYVIILFSRRLAESLRLTMWHFNLNQILRLHSITIKAKLRSGCTVTRTVPRTEQYCTFIDCSMRCHSTRGLRSRTYD